MGALAGLGFGDVEWRWDGPPRPGDPPEPPPVPDARTGTPTA